jgi:hypothetical protein
MLTFGTNAVGIGKKYNTDIMQGSESNKARIRCDEKQFFPIKLICIKKIDLEGGIECQKSRNMAPLPIEQEAHTHTFMGRQWPPTSPSDGSSHLSRNGLREAHRLT